MNKLTCAILEDDTISMTMMQGLVEKTGLLDIKNSFGSPEQAIPWLMDNEVDLLFLDVEMPGMTGLEMLRALSYKPDVIVISGKPSYAIEAFDLAVTDYLVKPVKDYARFLAAVNKVIVKRKSKASANTNNDSAEQSLYVKVNSLLLKIDVESILWIEAFGDYIKINTLEKVHTVYSTLKKVEEKLDTKIFVRVHRSFIINVTKITNIDPSNLEINKTIIPISSTYKDNLMEKINVI
jgi:DNA-binding LytR/AlgR family response regulator